MKEVCLKSCKKGKTAKVAKSSVSIFKFLIRVKVRQVLHKRFPFFVQNNRLIAASSATTWTKVTDAKNSQVIGAEYVKVINI